MTSVVLTKTQAAASANNIATSQTPASAGALTLVTAGGVTLDSQRRVLITSAANISATSFVITGTRDTGQTVSETLVGPNASTAQSIYDYRSVTSIVASGAAAGSLTVGTSGVGSTDWRNFDTRVVTFSASIYCTVSGSVNYSIELTNSRILASSFFPTLSINPQATTIANSTASASLNLSAMVRAWRLTILSGTGSVTVEMEQATH